MQKHVCSVKVFKTVRERNVQKSLQARKHLKSPMRRRRVIDDGYCMIKDKSQNGLKRLVNKLQNVMFSNTRTDCMQCYSKSTAQARGARVPKREKNLR